MKSARATWLRTALAGALTIAVWAIAAKKRLALELIWLPAVAVGAAWPRRTQVRACLPRLSNTITRKPGGVDALRRDRRGRAGEADAGEFTGGIRRKRPANDYFLGGRENRYPSLGGSRVRIPPPPLSSRIGRIRYYVRDARTAVP
jgi:hypothetical protein